MVSHSTVSQLKNLAVDLFVLHRYDDSLLLTPASGSNDQIFRSKFSSGFTNLVLVLEGPCSCSDYDGLICVYCHGISSWREAKSSVS